MTALLKFLFSTTPVPLAGDQSPLTIPRWAATLLILAVMITCFTAGLLANQWWT